MRHADSQLIATTKNNNTPALAAGIEFIDEKRRRPAGVRAIWQNEAKFLNDYMEALAGVH